MDFNFFGSYPTVFAALEKYCAEVCGFRQFILTPCQLAEVGYLKPLTC